MKMVDSVGNVGTGCERSCEASHWSMGEQALEEASARTASCSQIAALASEPWS